MKCRHCGTELRLQFLNLGSAPPANAYLSPEQLQEPETWLPLRLLVCEACWLVQTEDYARRESFFTKDYAYFSSYSTSWLEHARRYVAMAISRFGLGPVSCVAEVGANDGYLLQYVQAASIPCYGIEPTAGTARAARAKGIDIIEEFFGQRLASELASAGRRADLIVANNVLAHVPDINDFVSGIQCLIKETGVVTFEFPHLMGMVEKSQFDITYHEHFSYPSLTAVTRILGHHGLTVFDVEELPTQGGSLRVYAQRTEAGRHVRTTTVDGMLRREGMAHICEPEFYAGFQAKAEKVKNDLLAFLLRAKHEGVSVAGYGAAAKGNTLLNFAGIRQDLLPYVVDRNPAKQGKFLPGTRIPIVKESWLREYQPQRILIMPWNLKDEVMEQLRYVRDWGGMFVTAVPEVLVS